MPIEKEEVKVHAELPRKYLRLIAKYAFIQNMAFVIGIASYFLGGWLVKRGYDWIGTGLILVLPPLCGLTAVLTPKFFLKEYEKIKMG